MAQEEFFPPQRQETNSGQLMSADRRTGRLR
jgi:hypothetical protein